MCLDSKPQSMSFSRDATQAMCRSVLLEHTFCQRQLFPAPGFFPLSFSHPGSLYPTMELHGERHSESRLKPPMVNKAVEAVPRKFSSFRCFRSIETNMGVLEGKKYIVTGRLATIF